MIYKHYSDFNGDWCWNNFTPKELSCKCCGEYYHDQYSLDLIQSARTISGKSYIINSAHRCAKHNAEIHGAKNSEHLRIAFDISLAGHTKVSLLSALHEAGFTTFGMYSSFIHTDIRPWRKWYGCPERLWEDIYDRVIKED